MSWLDILLISLAITALLLVNTAGVLMVALQLPGTWVLVGATGLFMWMDRAWWHPDHGLIGGWTLGILLGLGLLGELVEGLASALGAKGAGGTKRGMVLALGVGVVGAVLGTVFLSFIPILGTLIGAALGAAVGSVLGDLWAGRDWKPALRAGRGAAVGRFAGSVGKLAVGVVMWAVVVVALIV